MFKYTDMINWEYNNCVFVLWHWQGRLCDLSNAVLIGCRQQCPLDTASSSAPSVWPCVTIGTLSLIVVLHYVILSATLCILYVALSAMCHFLIANFEKWHWYCLTAAYYGRYLALPANKVILSAKWHCMLCLTVFYCIFLAVPPIWHCLLRDSGWYMTLHVYRPQRHTAWWNWLIHDTVCCVILSAT